MPHDDDRALGGPAPGLDPTEGELRAWLAEATERIVTHLGALPSARAQVDSGSGPGAGLARLLRREAPPEEPAPLRTLLDDVFERALAVTYNTASPGYLAYVPGGGLPSAAVADLITAAINRYVTVWLAAPGLVEIEQNVVRWLLDLVGRGTGSFRGGSGVLLSGGSLANFTAVHTARAERLGHRPTEGVLYTSTEAHHSVQKAAHLAGFPPGCVRSLPVDEEFALDVEALERAVAEDRREGRRPFLVVAQAGSTNTGAIDPLPALADLCRAEGLWLHVDAAYGGPFLLTERGRALLAGIEGADSVTVDPHKGLFLPYGTGALLVRDGAALRRAHDVPGAYMPPMQDDPDHVDYCAMGPELSRPWRGLRVWLPLHVHGVGAFRRALDERIDLARRCAERVSALPDVRIVASPRLSLFAFRWEPAGLERAAVDDLNRRWLAAVNARGRVFLTGTDLAEGFAGRVCVLHFRTDAARVEMCLDDLAETQAELGERLDASASGGERR